ncbi:profilin-1-like [Crassostrea virginica]|uniref:Profilin n=1 Tax=Mucochytrium quahogii TaxID=96639 RepID=A0A7S2WHN7_9STRA
MSWDGWLPFMQSDGTNTCSHECGIFDTQGNPWAKTANCNATAANFADLNKLFNSGMECGVTSMTINSKKYFIIRADKEDKTVEGKCGPGGFCAAKGETFAVIGFYNDASVQPGNNKKQVEKCRGELCKALGQ